MARANRHHIPGQVRHITHRCHKKEFLLKFARDRWSWHSWLFEAKKRFCLRILNYVNGNGRIREEREVDRCVLREEPVPYYADFNTKNELLSSENGYFWDKYSADTAC